MGRVSRVPYHQNVDDLLGIESERLAERGALLLPWGALRDTLRADTDPAREALRRARDD